MKKQNKTNMKKVISTLSLVGVLATSIYAGNCGTTSTVSPKPQSGTAGLSPMSDSLPVVINDGRSINQVIYFENYDTTRTAGQLVTVQTLKIVAIDNLPTGLCWKTNVANNTFNGKQTGVIQVTGSTTDPAGQYKLKITVTAATDIATLNNVDAEAVTGLRYFVRVACKDNEATPLKVDDAAPYPSFKADSRPCPSAINNVEANISELSINPNPFSTVTKLSFTSENEEKYSVRLTNILGSVVFAQDIVSKNGGNNVVAIENKNYANGVYFVTITNGKSSVTRRVVIE